MERQDFLQQKKKQKTQTVILGLVFAVTIFVIWFGFLKKEGGQQIMQEITVMPEREINLNFKALEDPFLQDAAAFSSIQPLETGTSTGQAIGRENPFLPY